MKPTVIPGQTIGLVGGGQLGRMFTIVAQRMGYLVHVLTPSSKDPAALVSNQLTVAKYDDFAAVMHLADVSNVITYEFEGVDASILRAAQAKTPVFPNPDTLYIFQQRIREKTFLNANGFPIAESRPCATEEELNRALAEIGVPSILKTVSDGYDGKGQSLLESPEDASAAWLKLGKLPCILEKYINLQVEISVVVARDVLGSLVAYGPFENSHQNQILDVTTFPANISDDLKQQARELAARIAEKVELVGVLCVEYFVEHGGRLLVNEIAPRPHNSGHLTIEAFTCSQFEQQVRTVCGLPVAEARPLGEAAMVNLMGDLWEKGEPQWAAALSDGAVHLHLYGKSDPQIGRKMGHLSCVALTTEEARRRATKSRHALCGGSFKPDALGPST